MTAKVVDGVAILQGTVDTWLMWQTAMDQAIERARAGRTT